MTTDGAILGQTPMKSQRIDLAAASKPTEGEDEPDKRKYFVQRSLYKELQFPVSLLILMN